MTAEDFQINTQHQHPFFVVCESKIYHDDRGLSSILCTVLNSYIRKGREFELISMSSKSMTKRQSRFSRSTRGSVSRRTMSKNARGSVRVQQRAFPTSEVWVEDKNDGWACCKILEEDGSVLSLQNTKTREIFAVDSAFRDVYPCNAQVVSDMTSLRHHSEPGILYNIKQRWLDKHPYTFMGSVLIAVNPCEWYDHADINSYVGKPINADISHPFAIAGA